MVGITWTVCWWLINYSPYDLAAQVHNMLPVRMVTKVRSLLYILRTLLHS